MYQDRLSNISFEDLRRQTELAIRDLAGLPPLAVMDRGTTEGALAALPSTASSTKTIVKRASQGLSKEELMAKVALIKQQRALTALSRDHPTTVKLATPGESPYNFEVKAASEPTPTTPTEGSPANPEPQPATTSPPPPPPAARVPSIGVLAMGDAELIKILQDSTQIKGESVIAQLTFANNAVGPHQLPNSPVSPPTPTEGAERPQADRSLGLFFWIILGSVVLIVGIWVGFGVMEARSLARRRQQIVLDSVKRRTVDQKVLDTYKVRVFEEDDITYSDDDEDDDNKEGPTGQTSNTQQQGQQEQQDVEKGGSAEGISAAQDTVYDDKDVYRNDSPLVEPKALRVYPRADLNALRLVATDRRSYAGSTINTLALGRRSGSFDETVYGGLDSAGIRRGSTPGSIFWERRPSLMNASLALSRDERCRSWAESGMDMYDYGGESESEYGYDQEKGYKSHAQQGWADLQIETIETIKSLDAAKEVKAATTTVPVVAAESGKIATLEVVPATDALRRGSVPSLNVTPAATPSRETFTDAALPNFPPASARRGSAALLAQPTLKHKSRFILPRKIETDIPSLSVVGSGEITSPTIYGDIGSAGPSTAGFLPPAGWGGERRRSSLSTVAVPDNGRGVAQPNWIGPRGQRLRRSSFQVQRIGTPPLPSASENEGEDDEAESEGNQSDLDDGRGVGIAPLSASQRLRRSSQQVQRISFEEPLPPPRSLMDATPSSKEGSAAGKDRKETFTSPISDHKMRFSVIGIDLPDIYEPTAGEYSRLSLDADRFMVSGNKNCSRSLRQQVSEQEREQQMEQLQDSDSTFSRRSSRRSNASSGLHGKELTTTTMDTAITIATEGSSSTSSITATGGGPGRRQGGKQRKRRYDPCAICLEEYEVGDQLRELPCKHFFHSQCIDPWFKDVHGICPVCKRDYSEAGKVTPNSRRQASTNQRLEHASNVASFLAPLAMFATGASGIHHWYVAEASMHM
ncbi:hypothetical protein BGX29_004707 [Mortierella sp. GBA35]|nr:hypothetical protein BGX29_004707 [Mortierella sp. GBA35]